MNFLFYKQTLLTFVLNALIDLYFLDSSRKPTFLLLSRPSQSVLHAKQVELAPGSSQTMQNSLVSQSCQKYRPTKQILKLLSNGNYFPKCTKLHRYKWTPVKVTSTKYREILTFTSWPRLVNVYMY